jgi:alpha-galactosidase
VLKTNHLGHLYYGRRIDEEIQIQQMEMKYTVELGSSTTYSSESSPFSLNVALLEASTYGKGDYRDPMIHLEFEDGSRVSDFLYEKHKIIKGKPPIEDLPQVYTNDVSEAETLVVTLIDSIVDVSLELSYSVFEDADVIVRSLKIVNGNTQKIQIQKAMSVNFDHHESYFDLITLDGAWIKERQLVTRELQYGITKIDSKKGVSSADHNPFIALKRKNTDESMGECYGFALVYSGSFEATVEVNPQNLLRVLMGINSFDFKWLLDRNQEFQTPEVVMTYSNEGLNKLSQNYHKTVNKNIVRGAWKEKPRPILINNWEATYFDFTERKLLKIAKNAKKLGMELFVLDDGWLGKRTHDKTS